MLGRARPARPRLDARGEPEPAPAAHRVARVRGDVRDGPADLVDVEGHAEAALGPRSRARRRARAAPPRSRRRARREAPERHRPQDEPLRPAREVERLGGHPLEAVGGVDDGPRARPRPPAGATSPSTSVSAQPRMRVMGPRKSWASMPGHGAERGQALRGDELLLVGVVLDGERGAGGDERDEPGLGVGDRLPSPRGGPEDEHPGEAAPREQGHEHALLRARGRLEELALGEQPARPRRLPGRSPRAGRCASRPPSVRSRPSKLSRRRSHRRRVASCASSARGRSSVSSRVSDGRSGGFEHALGDPPERGAAASGGEGEDPHGAARLTPRKIRRYDTWTGRDARAAQADRVRGVPARTGPGGASPGANNTERRADDRGREPHQEVRPRHGGRRGVVPRREGRDPRLPGPERRREDDDHAHPHLLPAPDRGHGAGGRLRRLRAADGGQEAGRLPAGDAAALPRHERPRLPGLLRADQGRPGQASAGAGSPTRSRSAGSATCGTS